MTVTLKGTPIFASAPTRGPKPANPANPAAPANNPLPPALPAPGAGAAAAAPAWHGKTKALPFVVGAVLALALADTRAAPVVIAILTGAVIFQVMQL